MKKHTNQDLAARTLAPTELSDSDLATISTGGHLCGRYVPRVGAVVALNVPQPRGTFFYQTSNFQAAFSWTGRAPSLIRTFDAQAGRIVNGKVVGASTSVVEIRR